MENKPPVWTPFQEIDFNDNSILQYHIDTRDFHCYTSSENNDKDIHFEKLEKYPHKFFFTGDEVKNTIARLFHESGGENKWRMLMLEGEGEVISSGWELKYIRILRTEKG